MTTANPREIEAAISEAFHSGKPNFVLRRLQEQHCQALGNVERAEQLFVEADYMETFGDAAWRALCQQPLVSGRIAFMRDAVAQAKGAK